MARVDDQDYTPNIRESLGFKFHRTDPYGLWIVTSADDKALPWADASFTTFNDAVKYVKNILDNVEARKARKKKEV